MTETGTSSCLIRATPRASLIRNGVLSFLFVSVALFGSLYFLAAPLGTWPSILAIHLTVTILFVIAGIRYRQTFVGVRDNRLEYQGFLRTRWSVPISEVHSVTIVQTYRANSPETSAQFLARDVDGRRVLRMRGLFWYERDMHTIATALGRELEIRPDPLTTRDFLAAYPGSAFWFEGRPAIAIAGGVVMLGIAFGSVIGLMFLTGITVGLH